MSVLTNPLAIIVASIALSILGMLWYGSLFSRPWIRAMGWSAKDIAKAKKQSMLPRVALNLFTNLVMMTVLALLIGVLGITSGVTGALFGVLVWLGFIATSSAGSVIWEGYSPVAYAIYGGYMLVGFALTGAILAVW
jgi:hypothetical protein